MEATVNYIESLQIEDKIVLLGEMLELGEFSREEHSRLHALLIEKQLECFLIGESFNHIDEEYVFSSIQDFLAKISIESWRNKTILLKGSRGMKMEQLLDKL